MYDIDFSWALQEEQGEMGILYPDSAQPWNVAEEGRRMDWSNMLQNTVCLSFLSCKMGGKSAFMIKLLELFESPPKSAWIRPPSQIPRSSDSVWGLRARLGVEGLLGLRFTNQSL